jgi:CRISPR-associated protein Csx10
MNTYKLVIKLKSSTLVGSGVGFGAEIDTDIIFDELGLPYIPAKRIKGCLRDSIEEIEHLFSIAGIDKDKIDIEKTFGKAGDQDAAPVYFSNLYLPNYKNIREWLRYLIDRYKGLITHKRIIEYFTEIYQQTKINNNGAAENHSLRTIRVLKKGLSFEGEISIDIEEEVVFNTLCLACQNLCRLGTKRNRGFGEVTCQLFDFQGNLLDAERQLEELCIR